MVQVFWLQLLGQYRVQIKSMAALTTQAAAGTPLTASEDNLTSGKSYKLESTQELFERSWLLIKDKEGIETKESQTRCLLGLAVVSLVYSRPLRPNNQPP